MTHPSVKYSRLDSDGDKEGQEEEQHKHPESAFNYTSPFTYEDISPDIKYKRAHTFESAFTYSDNHVNINMDHVGNELETTASGPSPVMIATSWILTFLSYLFFILTLPLTYWVFVKKMGEFDRIVVFRLGKMIGVKGPGRFIIFPWMDRTKKIDIRAAAFSVPPQQFISADGGIVEMGAEIQYGIVDVVTMVREVADHQEILRSLGKTLLVKILVKKNVSQLLRDKRNPEREIMDEINDQVRKWGINVQSCSLSEAKIIETAGK